MTQAANLERIWRTLEQVPKGQVVTYGQLADLAGLPGRARLAARALRLAPAERALPWFRVIGAGGRISIPKTSPGYQRQMELLRNDGVEVNNGRIKLSEYQWQPDLAALMWQLEF
ncbi:MGMT family protein [Ferrimonas marina]|uniref:Methylated-DNA-protein-cysteine methyltransferase related protein n=1 Tax=Ferrimonas marina TaxID=299255 RepID=A0A1M5Z5Z2_9GAMM|nr:MGMT family protein [Ferrimonas marina]SHI19518.1 methylated-DNA-protein-cysteine methyltransferase related protein [Ferrimonas marina]